MRHSKLPAHFPTQIHMTPISAKLSFLPNHITAPLVHTLAFIGSTIHAAVSTALADARHDKSLIPLFMANGIDMISARALPSNFDEILTTTWAALGVLSFRMVCPGTKNKTDAMSLLWTSVVPLTLLGLLRSCCSPPCCFSRSLLFLRSLSSHNQLACPCPRGHVPPSSDPIRFSATARHPFPTDTSLNSNPRQRKIKSLPTSK
jgi:hypothetical protein